MKKLAILLALIIILGSANAVQVRKQEIEMDIDSGGYAHIVEKYYVDYESTEDRLDFIKMASDNSSSLLAWKVDLDWFYPRFGAEDQSSILRSYVAMDEKERTLTLDYFLKDKFATTVSDEVRETKWKIADKQLRAFLKSGLLVIPDDVTITIRLP